MIKNIVLILISMLMLSTQGSVSIESFIDSEWFQEWEYRDCFLTAKKVWPSNFIDCLMSDKQLGPSEIDSTFFADPPGLAYKHLSPGGRTMFRSLQSMMPGTLGDELHSVSLMVHPASEKSILKNMIPRERVESFYKPFVEAMADKDVSVDDLLPLYEAAKDDCDNALGTHIFVGSYVVVVQKWQYNRDCNIHVVRR